MPISQWNQPSSLVSPQGTIVFNAESGGYFYVLDATACDAGAGVRVTKDNVPQGDGSILHRRFFEGYEVRLTVQYYETADQIACDEVAVDMHDNLMKILRPLTKEDGRFYFTPPGQNQRMFDSIRLLERAQVAPQESTLIVVRFGLDTPFPYAINAAETTTDFSGSNTTQILTNTGTAPFYPVWKVYGSTYYWTITNNTTGLQIVYNADLPGGQEIPGAGDYAEIDSFRNTIYLNGDEDNLKPGIDIEETDFFPLEVGANEIIITGDGTFPAPDVECLWQAAWA